MLQVLNFIKKNFKDCVPGIFNHHQTFRMPETSEIEIENIDPVSPFLVVVVDHFCLMSWLFQSSSPDATMKRNAFYFVSIEERRGL